MAVTRITDVVLPEEFTGYIVQNTMKKSALVHSGVAARNSVIQDQLRAGADSFNVPFWLDLGDDEADITNDDPNVESTPKKLTAEKQVVGKSFLHNSWSAMNLASELTGDDALQRIQNRVEAYWTRQAQRRLIASLNGVMADNVANDGGDMVHDITGLTAGDELFSAEAVIDAAGTLGDQMGSVAGIAMHSNVYRAALKNDLIETVRDSDNRPFQTFRGMAVIVDDLLPAVAGATDADPLTYTTALFGPGAIGWAMTEPRIADGTEIESNHRRATAAGSKSCTAE